MRNVYFDLETADADRLYTYGRRFVRLAGYAINDGPVTITEDIDALCAVLTGADRVVAHNAIAFDLAALEHWHSLDVGRLVDEGRVRDTLLLARHNDPPRSDHLDDRRYGLEELTATFGVEGKLREGDYSTLTALADEFGGYDQIPTSERRYRAYLTRDVEVLREVYAYLRCDAYALREHRVMWRLSHISRYGLRVDTTEVERRLDAQAERVARTKQRMHEMYGLPLTGKAPHATGAGRAAIKAAFDACGVAWPTTEKGNLATKATVLRALVEEHPDNAGLRELCETLTTMTGERSVDETIRRCTHPDGRVHPTISASQATGRISVTKPGLTVLGKRTRANALERATLLPDHGDVLMAFDLSQIDIRAMSARSQDANHLTLMQPDQELDFHERMAVQLFGDKSRRNDAKASAHAINYGQVARNLATDVGVTVQEAESILATIRLTFPRLELLKQQQRQAAFTGLLTNAFGRPIRVTAGREHTQGPAHTGQGDARDLMMEGILRLPEWLLPCLRAIVHDEIVLSVPADRADEAEAAVLHALQFEYRITPDAMPVPILAQASDRGRDWADCYRSEKAAWPEVSRTHREQPTCEDRDCTWHTTDEKETAA